MAHPVVWTPKSFFYAIGNTPATAYTEYLPPELDAEVLVLGCGDPRSALYTIHTDSKNNLDRAPDFTFCEIEPAVLARNVLIYTLLADKCDKETISSVWKIYFDVVIDRDSFDLLASQCAKLVEHSSSLDSWNASPYSTILKFCTASTLASLRGFWKGYTAESRDAADVLKLMKETYARKIGGATVLTAMRSAGVAAMELGMRGPEHFKHYWSHGVTDVDPAEVRRAKHVNPTLLHTSSVRKGLDLHYGTDPMTCFHLAPALIAIQGNNATPAKDLAGIIAVAKSQFADWCRSFHERTKKGKLVLRFFAGDAMNLCKALKYASRTGSLITPEYTSMWGGSIITFADASTPFLFNVIDTSNLADHLGILNILLVATPVLKRHPSSILFTHSLLMSKDRKTTHSSALEKIAADVPFLSLVFGLVPDRVRLDYTSHSIGHEVAMSSLNESYQLFEFNAWRITAPDSPSLRYTFTCDSDEDLAQALFNAYLNIFSDEGFGGVVDAAGKAAVKHSVRDTYVALLAFVKDAYGGDWPRLIHMLMGRITQDRTLILGANGFQEFFRGLDETGLDTTIVPDPRRFSSAPKEFCYERWRYIPKIVNVVLVVPRAKVQPLIDMTDTVKPAMLDCRVESGLGLNIFMSIRPIFGRVETKGEGEDREVVVHEDEAGWEGKSDLVLHFTAPAWIFVQKPLSQYKIGLFVFGMSALAHFREKLGITLCVYGTDGGDSDHVYVVKNRPLTAGQPIPQEAGGVASFVAPPLIPGADMEKDVLLKLQGSKPASFTIRVPVTDEGAKTNLAEKTTQVTTKALSITSVHVSFKGFRETINFPYPVNNAALITRIARKSSFIEVEAKIATSARVSYDLHPFPVTLSPTGPHELGLHYLPLPLLPAVRGPLPPGDDATWIQRHLAFSLTEENRLAKAQQASGSGAPKYGLWDVKESLTSMLTQMVQHTRCKPEVFQLADPENGGIYMVVFVSCLRLDVTGNTVILDTCVLPITKPLISEVGMQKALANLTKTVECVQVTTVGDEVGWWKAFLPSCVERCRNWAHKKGECEYEKEGVPRSLKMEEDPLCSCGRGKDLGEVFESVKQWKPFKERVTRAAISIPFSTSLMGGIAKELTGLAGSAAARGVAPQAGASGAAATLSGGETCRRCGGPGKPKLLMCGQCKVVKYCSPECQKVDWKTHKRICAK